MDSLDIYSEFLYYYLQLDEWDRKVIFGILLFMRLKSKPRAYFKIISLRNLALTIVGAIEYYRLKFYMAQARKE